MINLRAAGVVLFALATIDAAGARSPDPPPPPAYTWTGCYAGVNGGYGWNNGSTSYNDPNTTSDPINFVPLAGFTFAYIPTPSGTGGSGGVIGGTGGCNFQMQQWVVGFETDMDWAHFSGNTTKSVNSGPLVFQEGPALFTGITATGTANEQVSVQWLSTFRARVGLAVLDHTLLYATGGLALGGVNTQGSVTLTTPFPGFANPAWTGSSSTVKAGGVVGGGAEWAFHDRWTVKAEYLWYSLGTVSHQLNCTATNFPATACGSPAGLYATLGNASSSVYGSILRVGINYKFY